MHGKYDVIVCGGGTSGVPAAIASARAGAKTLLIERLGALGGQMTVSGPPGFAYAHMFNDCGEQIINGFLGETHDRLLKDGHALPYPPREQRTATSFAFVDPEWCQRALRVSNDSEPMLITGWHFDTKPSHLAWEPVIAVRLSRE